MSASSAVELGSYEDRLLTADEVSELLGISAYTIREWARDRRMPSVRLGRAVRFRLSSVQSWIAEQER